MVIIKGDFMAKYYTSAEQLIGNTPLLKLCNLEKKHSLSANLFAKLEYLNPAGSVKDRVGKAMLDDAEKKGLISKNSVIIEPTSGNTGIGIAAVAAARGYKAIIVMPETMSEERRKLMKAFGAELVLTDGTKGMSGAIEKAKELKNEIAGSIIAGQFENIANAEAHYKTTGPEIYSQLDGNVDIFISAVGTGGTITGCGKYLKEQNPNIKVVAVEPESSAVLSGKEPGKHAIQGIGAGFIPKVLDVSVIDEIITVSDNDAIATARYLGHTEGFLCGISSGAALFAAIEIAKRPENKNKNIAIILPDSGSRYLSTNLYSY